MNKKILNPYLLSIISGILCILSFPPFNFSFLIWFALTPLIYSIIILSNKKESSKIIYQKSQLIGLLFGIVFYFGTLYWIYNIFNVFGILLLLILCVFPCIFSFILCYLNLKIKSKYVILFLPFIIWTSIEYFRSEAWNLKFTWMGLGYSQHNFLPILQFAQVLGIYGLTALIVLVNSIIIFMIIHKKNKKIFFKSLFSLVIIQYLRKLTNSFGILKILNEIQNLNFKEITLKPNKN